MLMTPAETAAYRRVQAWLVAGMRAEATLHARERAACGDMLARLGDPRPGVGLGEDGLPDIDWCRVPAGPFLMGSDKAKDALARVGEEPHHTVVLPEFAIGRYPVTNAQYASFVAAGGFQERRFWTEAGWEWKGELAEPDNDTLGDELPNHPVARATWYEAVAFCRWLTEQLRRRGKIGQEVEVRLPTEAEWQKAARGTDGRIYPWGNEFDAGKCNMQETGIGHTSAVGCFPGGASPYGVEEMSGNVWEWCATQWRWDDSDRRHRVDSVLEEHGCRMMCGGAYYDNPQFVRCANSVDEYPDICGYDQSFRCVVAAPL